VRDLADELYEKFLKLEVEVLLDNRKERAGIMFADSELLGIPHRLVISDTHADNGNVEYKGRNEVDKIEIEYNSAVDFITSKLYK
jgi:prolyl-tRNA synthetase